MIVAIRDNIFVVVGAFCIVCIFLVLGIKTCNNLTAFETAVSIDVKLYLLKPL